MMAKTWAEALLSVLEKQSPLTILFVTLLAILLTTRFITGVNSAYGAKSNGARTAPAVPYWLPFLGHVPQLAIGPDGFLRRLQQAYPGGVFNLSIFGKTHTIILKHSLAKALLSKPESEASSAAIRLELLKTVFGLPPRDLERFEKAFPQLIHNEEKMLAKSEGEKMTKRAADLLRHNIADFVTFNNSQVDQSPWEIAAGSVVEENVRGDPVVEADLLALVRNFVAHTASPSLLGSDFVINFPEFWSPFWAFDDGFHLMAAQWPRWLPSARLNRARGALNALFRITSEFETAMEKQWSGQDPGSTWQDIDDVGAVIQGRMDVYRERGISISGRAANELALVWGMNSHINALVFWLLFRINSVPNLLAQIRSEIEPFMKIFEPSGGFGATVVEPSRLKNIDVQGIATKCPLLMATYRQCLRIDADIWSSRYLKQDIVLDDHDGKESRILLKKGTHVHVSHNLGQSRESRLAWHAREAPQIVNDDTKPDHNTTERDSELGSLMRTEILIFTAAILRVWDIEPCDGKPWKKPPASRSFGVRRPKSDVRVWVKQRV